MDSILSKPITRRRLLTGAGGLLGCVALAQVAPASAFAAPGDKFTVLKEGFSNLPLSTVAIYPSEMSLTQAVSFGTTGDVEIVRDKYGSYNDGIVPHALAPKRNVKGAYDVSGTFTARWENIGVDSDGTPLNATLVCDRFHVDDHKDFSVDSRYIPVFMTFNGPAGMGARTAINCQSGSVRTTLSGTWSGDPHKIRPCWFRLAWRFTRKDGSPMRGMVNFCMRDVDIRNQYDEERSEGFTVLSGFGDKLWLAPDTIIKADPQTGLVRSDIANANPPVSPVPNNDNDTERSQVFLLASSEFSYEWQGMGAQTGVFVEVKQTHGLGGVQKTAKRVAWA